MESHGSLEAFPMELIKKIYTHLGYKSKTKLAITCRTYFNAFQMSINPTPFAVRNFITVIQLRTLTDIIIEDKYCNPRIVAHLFTYCRHLERITFMRRGRIADTFLDIFFNSNVTRRVTYLVPECHFRPFEDRQQLFDNITLEMYED